MGKLNPSAGGDYEITVKPGRFDGPMTPGTVAERSEKPRRIAPPENQHIIIGARLPWVNERKIKGVRIPKG